MFFHHGLYLLEVLPPCRRSNNDWRIFFQAMCNMSNRQMWRGEFNRHINLAEIKGINRMCTGTFRYDLMTALAGKSFDGFPHLSITNQCDVHIRNVRRKNKLFNSPYKDLTKFKAQSQARCSTVQQSWVQLETQIVRNIKIDEVCFDSRISHLKEVNQSDSHDG